MARKRVPADKRDKWVSRQDDVFIMKADGTLLNPEVVERAIKNGVDVGEDFRRALEKKRREQSK